MSNLKHKKLIPAIIAGILCLAILAIIAVVFELNVFKHNPYDSYTRQALAWREGRTWLDNDPGEIAYLELAIFEGKYYVSFPPVPSVVEFFLTFIFGQNTPNQFMLYVYAAISCVALTLVFCRKHDIFTSVCFGLMASLGSNLLGIVAFGGVWHEAQAMAFMLCSLAVLFICSDNKFLNGFALFCAALAVGCRPFTVLFIPFLLYKLYKKNKTVIGLWPYLIAPAVVAIALMAYNYVRFGNPIEFGHNYLPEFTRSEDGQFSLKYLWPNLIQAIKLPFVYKPEFKLYIDPFTANMFYVFNPIIGVFLFYNIRNCFKVKKAVHYLWFIAFAGFVVVTCMHKTLGGCQFGARYFIDMIPYLALYLSTCKLNSKPLYGIVTAFALALNIYGAYFVSVKF